ncbi:MAG: hypothetical protein M0Q54_12095 [Pigmentiphaga sp.]|nr:hypothetical protein [Pigmentiphaga sp.]
MQDRYLVPIQTRRREPTDFENLFGDSLERAFSQGIHDLEGIAAHLNEHGPSAPFGKPWTAEFLESELARLADH